MNKFPHPDQSRGKEGRVDGRLLLLFNIDEGQWDISVRCLFLNISRVKCCCSLLTNLIVVCGCYFLSPLGLRKRVTAKQQASSAEDLKTVRIPDIRQITFHVKEEGFKAYLLSNPDLLDRREMG